MFKRIHLNLKCMKLYYIPLFSIFNYLDPVLNCFIINN